MLPNIKLLSILTFVTLCSLDCIAQTDSTATPTDSIKTKSTLTVGTIYTNNASYYGQKAEKSIPYIAAVASYRLRSGIYFTGLGYRLLKDSGSIVSAGSAGIGVGFKISKRFTGDINYSHTFYPTHSPFIQASNPDNASASISYDKWLVTKLNVDYSFGKTNDVFATIGTSKLITLGHFSDKDGVTLTPGIDVTGGTQHFYQSYLVEKRYQDSIVGGILGPILGTPPSSGGSTTKTTKTTEFNLLSYTLKAPLAYYRSKYIIEAEYQLSVLSNKAVSAAGKANSFFNLSFYYQF